MSSLATEVNHRTSQPLTQPSQTYLSTVSTVHEKIEVMKVRQSCPGASDREERPQPVFSFVTRWESDIFPQGSYSCLPCVAAPADIAQFRAPEKWEVKTMSCYSPVSMPPIGITGYNVSMGV